MKIFVPVIEYVPSAFATAQIITGISQVMADFRIAVGLLSLAGVVMLAAALRLPRSLFLPRAFLPKVP